MKTTHKITFGWFVLLALILVGNSQSGNASGYVYLDENRNLQRDANEPGIESVLVSNQLDVVATDEFGFYTLPVNEGDILFISKPAGYNLPVSSLNIPQFYYIHSPQGSPESKYGGVQPTGELPEEVNFPLHPGSNKDRFEVVVFSDPQPRDLQEIAYIRDDVVAELSGTTARFGIVLGDIMYDDLSLFESYTEVIAQMEIPFYHVPGNHDMNFDAKSDHYSLETYKRMYGPPYYGFEYGDVHFIVLDDIEYLGLNENGRPSYQGKLGEKQLQWLENYLPYIPEDRLLVFNMHIPLYSFAGDHPAINVSDRSELFRLLKDRQHLLGLAGHMHTVEHQFLGPVQGWNGNAPFQLITCAAVSGSWWSGPPDIRGIPVADQRDGVPNGYHIFTFNGNSFKERFKAAHFGDEYQLRISQPADSLKIQDIPDTPVIVNVFNGNEKSVVQFQMNEGPVQIMTREIRQDPFFEQLYQQNKEYYREWIKPENSNHIWTSPVPDDLEPGIHKITVYVTSQYGDKYTAFRLFEIFE
jgi:hypothetical protein